MKTMKKFFLTIVLFLMAMSLMAACGNKPKNAETITETAEGQVTEANDDLAPDFELPTMQGSTLKLSSLRGKYVIIDFWGSWCIWCIRGFPKMKATYTKYKDKMEILGVDCNDTEIKWKTAVDEYALPWLQVRCPNKDLPALAAKYHVQGFPTKVIVDPKGKIIKIVSGEDPAFYTFLDELFSK